jgi:uncharacterized protein, YhcH/YjgK/YiaL family
MILGHIGQFEQEKRLLPAALKTGLEYLVKTDLGKLAIGKHEIAGSDIFASVMEYTTAPKEERKPEAHVKYADIQYIISGEENIGFGVLAGDLPVREDKLAEKDIIFYKEVPGESDLKLTAGMYAIFFPWDVHRPSCAAAAPAPVRKVVVKVKMDLLR